jgi:hypothetical protein
LAVLAGWLAALLVFVLAFELVVAGPLLQDISNNPARQIVIVLVVMYPLCLC